MKIKPIHIGEASTYAVICEEGDEVISCLTNFARQNALHASYFTAIGALRDVLLGFFDPERKDYKKIPVEEQVEVLSLLGNIVLEKGEPMVHAHVVVGTSEGQTRGGHLMQGHVRPTLEIIVTESPRELQRHHDEKSGLALIRI